MISVRDICHSLTRQPANTGTEGLMTTCYVRPLLLACFGLLENKGLNGTFWCLRQALDQG
jgi:hypothetical protein